MLKCYSLVQGIIECRQGVNRLVALSERTLNCCRDSECNSETRPYHGIESGLQTGNSGDKGELCPLVQGCLTTRMEHSWRDMVSSYQADPEDGELDRRTT